MANVASSSSKRQRQSERRRLRNRQNRSTLRTGIKKCRALAAEGKAGEAKNLLFGETATAGESKKKARGLISLIDKSAKKGAVHKKAAARTKSRLMRQVNALTGATK
jgi:small subunit ribosomal protein S20